MSFKKFTGARPVRFERGGGNEMDNLLNSVRRLQAGLEHHDSFGALSDETPVYLVAHGSCTLYELPYGTGKTSGQFALGDLRNILALLKEHGIAQSAPRG